jgi:cell division septation protein DedD
MRWLNGAADAGEPRALLMVGTALYNGDGVARDPVKAYAYVSRAAAQGLAPAKATLADMDKVLPLADRQKGVALALKLAVTKSAAKPAPKIPAPKIAKAAPKPVPLSAAATKPAPPVAIAGTGGWRIQLGAFGNRGAAQALFARLGPKLGGAQAYYIPVGAMTRLQAGPYSKADATAACARLKPQPCFVVAAK